MKYMGLQISFSKLSMFNNFIINWVVLLSNFLSKKLKTGEVLVGQSVAFGA